MQSIISMVLVSPCVSVMALGKRRGSWRNGGEYKTQCWYIGRIGRDIDMVDITFSIIIWQPLCGLSIIFQKAPSHISMCVCSGAFLGWV